MVRHEKILEVFSVLAHVKLMIAEFGPNLTRTYSLICIGRTKLDFKYFFSLLVC